MKKVVISNIRFPQDEWITLKSAAQVYGMSVNEYLRYLNNLQSIKMITGKDMIKITDSGYKALNDLVGLASKSKRKGMEASEEDRVIYDIE